MIHRFGPEVAILVSMACSGGIARANDLASEASTWHVSPRGLKGLPADRQLRTISEAARRPGPATRS